MTDLNLLDFYKDSARALLILQRQFPRPMELYVADLIGDDQIDEFGLHSKRHMSCLGAFLWLADEGFLRYATCIRQEAIDQAVLTGKSLVLLSALDSSTPGDLHKQPLTLAERIDAALQSGSSDQLGNVMKYFFTKSQNILPTNLRH